MTTPYEVPVECELAVTMAKRLQEADTFICMLNQYKIPVTDDERTEMCRHILNLALDYKENQCMHNVFVAGRMLDTMGIETPAEFYQIGYAGAEHADKYFVDLSIHDYMAERSGGQNSDT